MAMNETKSLASQSSYLVDMLFKNVSMMYLQICKKAQNNKTK